jgi:hypothetical protein
MLKEKYFKPISELTESPDPKAEKVPFDSLDNEITINHVKEYFKRFPQREAIVVIDDNDKPIGVIERKLAIDYLDYGLTTKGGTLSASTLEGELAPDTILPKFSCPDPECGYEDTFSLYNRKSPIPKCDVCGKEMARMN